MRSGLSSSGPPDPGPPSPSTWSSTFTRTWSSPPLSACCPNGEGACS
jgi:hypothetical protein